NALTLPMSVASNTCAGSEPIDCDTSRQHAHTAADCSARRTLSPTNPATPEPPPTAATLRDGAIRFASQFRTLPIVIRSSSVQCPRPTPPYAPPGVARGSTHEPRGPPPPRLERPAR